VEFFPQLWSKSATKKIINLMNPRLNPASWLWHDISTFKLKMNAISYKKREIMKRKIIYGLVTIFLIVHTGIMAQEITPEEGFIVYKNAPRACWVVHLDPEPKTLKKAWKDYLDDEFGFSLKGIGLLANRDLLSAEEVMVKPIANDPLNLYTQIVEDVNGSEMKFFVELKSNVYASDADHRFEFRAMQDILQDFLAEYLPTYYQSRVQDAEKRLVSLAEEREDLKKNIAKDSEKIEELQNEIEQRQLELESNQDRLDLAEAKLEARKEKLERIRSQLR
jgi:hypothetical protein